MASKKRFRMGEDLPVFGVKKGDVAVVEKGEYHPEGLGLYVVEDKFLVELDRLPNDIFIETKPKRKYVNEKTIVGRVLEIEKPKPKSKSRALKLLLLGFLGLYVK